VRRSLPLVLCALLACGTPEADGSGDVTAGTTPILPDTQTVDGVLVMRHGADAFARAPRWVLEDAPSVVVDGGAEHDLSYVYRPVPLSDGRFVALRNIGGAELMLFGADGTFERVLAGTGQGPGELMAASEPIVLPGDTLVVVDDPSAMINWYHPDSGFVRSERGQANGSASCFDPTGRLADGRLVAIGNCSSNRMHRDGTLRAETPLLVFSLGYLQADTAALVPGARMAMMTVRQGDRAFETPRWVRLGQFTTVTAVDSTIVVADGVGGYVLRLLTPEGTERGRIEVARPLLPVSDELRQRVIDEQIRRLEERTGGERMAITMDEARREIREEPTADTLPAYARVMPGEDGSVWVIDYIVPGDSTWAATAFRLDGTILGRVTGQRHAEGGGSGPVWFGRDRIIVRELDEDGVVRFGVYRVER